MKANIQVKYVNSKLTVFVDGKEVVPEKSSFLPTISGFSVDIDVDTQGASDFTVSPELNVGNLAKDMPMKGEGIFKIHDEEKIPLAYEILKDHVGEFEFEYCPDDFITAGRFSDYQYYGKFEIENLDELYEKMAEKGVIVIKADFMSQLDL
jgi:hypothetical protein